MLTCQFCHEDDFDELGLAIHLANYCMGDQSPKLNSLAYRESAQKVSAVDGIGIGEPNATLATGTSIDYGATTALPE